MTEMVPCMRLLSMTEPVLTKCFAGKTEDIPG